jgi:hypothetical protein
MFNQDVESHYEVTFFGGEKKTWRRGHNNSPKSGELNFNVGLYDNRSLQTSCGQMWYATVMAAYRTIFVISIKFISRKRDSFSTYAIAYGV